MNTFSDITVDCGVGNEGAEGLRFVSSNSGRIENSRFISHGGKCAIRTSVSSEGVAENIEISGFDYGIISTDTAPLVWTDIKMSGIGSAGILAGGLTILNNVTCAGTPLLQFAEGYGACFADGTNVNADLSAGNNTLYVRNGEMLSVSGRKTKLPFGNDRPNLKLTMPEFPRNTRPADFKDWVCVDDFGAGGDGNR